MKISTVALAGLAAAGMIAAPAAQAASNVRSGNALPAATGKYASARSFDDAAPAGGEEVGHYSSGGANYVIYLVAGALVVVAIAVAVKGDHTPGK